MVLNVTDAVYSERQPADHSAGCPVSCVKLYFIMVYPHGNCNYKICTKWLQFVFYLRTGRGPRQCRGPLVHRLQFWYSSGHAAGAAHIAGGGGIHEDQPRHVDIVLFRRLLGRMIAPDAALIDGGRSVLLGTFLPVYPKIQFDGSAMALRTKTVISSPSRSTLRSMSASIRFHRNCRKKPT